MSSMKGSDDCAKGSTNDDCDRKINHIATKQKFTKVSHKTANRAGGASASLFTNHSNILSSSSPNGSLMQPSREFTLKKAISIFP